MSHLGVFLVDDEPLARRRLALMLREIPGARLLGESEGGADALSKIEALKPDVLLLDISMPEMDGFELSRRLDPEAPPGVIFVTAFNHHALRAWDEGAAAAYLLKPVGLERLRAALDRARTQLQARDAEERIAELTHILQTIRTHAPVAASTFASDFWALRQGARIRVRTEDILWIEAERDYARLHTAEESFLVRQTLSKLAERLDPTRFTRIHRSTIVRLDEISEVRQATHGALEVVLRSGLNRPVGRSYASHVRGVIAMLAQS